MRNTRLRFVAVAGSFACFSTLAVNDAYGVVAALAGFAWDMALRPFLLFPDVFLRFALFEFLVAVTARRLRWCFTALGLRVRRDAFVVSVALFTRL
jgi:hypothetical protein